MNSISTEANRARPDDLPAQLSEHWRRLNFADTPTEGDAAARRALVVAVSGGMDSVALLHALAQRAAEWRLDLHVAHVDHGLRPESHMDAAFTAELAAALGLPFHQTTLSPDHLRTSPDGVEAAARRARYRCLFQVAENVAPRGQVPGLVLAHHAGDQAETVLLHLVRGSGLRGLAGMRMCTVMSGAAFAEDRDDPVMHVPRVHVLRPLLGISRATIAAYAEHHGLSWREDASNADVTLTRNYIRHTVLPELAQINPQIVATLNRTATLIADDWERLAALDRRALAAAMVTPPHLEELSDHTHPPRIVIALPTFNGYDQATKRGVLRLALTLLTPPDQPNADQRQLDYEQIERVLAGVREAHSTGPHPIAGGLAWSIMGEWPNRRPPYLSLHRADALPFLPAQPLLPEEWTPLPIPGHGVIEPVRGWRLHSEFVQRRAVPAQWQHASPWSCRLDAEKSGPLLLCVPAPGMTITPTGMHGHTKLLADLFGDAKLHHTLRPRWPIVVDQRTGRVLWVCGLRTAEDAAIRADTTKVRHLRWEQAHATEEE